MQYNQYKRDCWDFLHKSVKGPIRIIHALFTENKKIQLVGQLSEISDLQWVSDDIAPMNI